MSWSISELSADAAPQLEIWHDIVCRSRLRHPLLDHDYVGLVIEHLAPGRPLYWLQRRDAGRAECIGIVERRGRGQWSSWYLPQFAVAPLAATSAPAKLPGEDPLACMPGYAWRLRIHDVDPAYVTLQSSLPGLPQTSIPTHQTVAIDFGPIDYWSTRPRDLQRNVARSLRKLAAEVGEPRLLRLQGVELMAQAVADHALLEQSGWKGHGGSAMQVDDALGRFYRAVLERYAASGHARAYQLHAGSELVASQLCIVKDQVLVTMKTAYSGQRLSCSPGRLLDHLMLQELQFDPEVRRCEFCVHAGKFERQWATELRTLQLVESYRNAALRNTAVAGRRLWRRLSVRRSAET